MELLCSLAFDHKPADVAYGYASDLWLHDYLSRKTKLMQATPGVANPFGWLRRAVMEDWK